jgi:hypothetical protein
MQLAEALGPVNRWFASQARGRHVENPEELITHFVRNGGAEDFALRFEHAMSEINRWYCSQFHRREVREEHVLWEYYMHHSRPPRGNADPREPGPGEADSSDGMTRAS